MQNGPPAQRSFTLSILAVLFISAYFFLFSYDGLNAYFTYDDGMNLLSLHHLWEVPLRTNILDVLKVFTAAYRPLGALIYRPLYNLFGFNPLPFRIVAYLLMCVNIVLAYRFSRALDATPEAATLATLLFCYNGSMIDLYYNSGTIYDLLCFLLYIGAALVYIRRRSDGRPLTIAAMVTVMLLFFAALDAKEMAVTLPAVLLLYEALYRYRDFRSPATILRTGGFLAVMFLATAAYLKIKVADMGNNALYHPHLSIEFILSGIGHYFEQLFYLVPESFGSAKVGIALVLLLAAAAVLRSRPVAYGTLFFFVGLLPLSVINHRGGYAAYVAYPGLTLALAVILASARSWLLRISGKENRRVASMVALFLCVAVTSVTSFAHTRKILMSNALWDQQRRIDLFTGLKRRIPEFPAKSRVLILDDPWGPDWGQMFLIQLMYHDPTVWVDRVKNSVETGGRDSYDLFLTYQQPFLGTTPSRLFGVRKSFEIHWTPLHEGQFTLTASHESRTPRNLDFSPSASRAGRPVKLTVPGLANVKIDVIYRLLSNGNSWTQSVENWCSLDAQGACTITTPHAGPVATFTIDWVRPSKGRWIFTNGVLTLVE